MAPNVPAGREAEMDRALAEEVLRQLEIQVYRLIDRELGKPTDPQTDRNLDQELEQLMDTQVRRSVDGHLHREIQRQLDQEIFRQVNREIDRQILAQSEAAWNREVFREVQRGIDQEIFREMERRADAEFQAEFDKYMASELGTEDRISPNDPAYELRPFRLTDGRWPPSESHILQALVGRVDGAMQLWSSEVGRARGTIRWRYAERRGEPWQEPGTERCKLCRKWIPVLSPCLASGHRNRVLRRKAVLDFQRNGMYATKRRDWEEQ